MRKVFWENSYQSKLLTDVVAVNGNDYLFSETIAYSFSGGQESDDTVITPVSRAGAVSPMKIPVLQSRMEKNLIYYSLADNMLLEPGQKVLMEINWPNRYRRMRLHFAAELVLEIITQRYGLQKIGANITAKRSRVDFLYPDDIRNLFPEILGEFNRIIEKDALIKTGYDDVATQRRYWKIDDYAKVPCGGTHVRSTAEVGFMDLKRESLSLSKKYAALYNTKKAERNYI